MLAISPSQVATLRTYAVGDIHGRLDLLRAAANTIWGHASNRPFRIVFLGDYVDRGPDSRGVIEFLIDLQRRWQVCCLKGNHEEMMVRAVEDPGAGRLERWLEYGGEETLQSYGLNGDDDLLARIPSEHTRWMSNLPRSISDNHRIYVHAGLMPRTPLDGQTDETCLWIRERFLQGAPGDFKAHVVHGHTPVWEGKTNPAEPELLEHRTNLDTGAFATGVLSIAVFDAAIPGGPVEMLKVRGAPTLRDASIPPASASSPEAERRRPGIGGWFSKRVRTAAFR